MSDELHLPSIDLLAPRADFSDTRPLIWSAGHIYGMDLDICRALVQPALHLRLEFKPDTSQDAIHALQRELAVLLESTDLLGAYPDDEQYLVIGLLRSMSEDDGHAIASWLSAQPVVAVVRYADVQLLAQVLADIAGREFGEEQPLASGRFLSLIRRIEPGWNVQRWALRQALQARESTATPASDEEAAS